tara:strand:- start:306 stop:632 length:327 start_codon:yes stop_codon:yes gene_type:complete
MNGLLNKTKIQFLHSSSAAGITGSIQKIYAPQGCRIGNLEFGYFERVGQTGSKSITTDTLIKGLNEHTDTGLILEKGETLEGPIIQVNVSGSIGNGHPIIVYLNNVRI